MAASTVPIRYSDESQEADAVQEAARDVAKVLTPNEELLYIAMQNVTAISLKRDGVVATTNRLILFQPHILGRVNLVDFQWQDVKNVAIEQGILATNFTVEATDGRTGKMTNLDKDQAKRLYGICQQMEQEWREKRRIREMEKARARSGGIYMAPPQQVEQAASSEDSVAKLAKAKAMLDQGLISEAEYDTLKAKILASI